MPCPESSYVTKGQHESSDCPDTVMHQSEVKASKWLVIWKMIANALNWARTVWPGVYLPALLTDMQIFHL